jgi:sulfate transport system ATP-binding protein
VRKDLRRWLRDIHERSGQTTIFVTHDQDEALEFANRVAILHSGKVEQIGTPDEVYDAPASRFVMSFIGEASALPVRIDGEQVWLGEQKLHGVDVAGVPSGCATLYVRPVDVSLSSDSLDALAGVVRSVRRVGNARLIEIALRSNTETLELDVDTGGHLESGAHVFVRVRRGRFFHQES